MIKNILVTGGAGYIGSATVKELIKLSYNVIIIDNLSNGDIKYIDKKAKFYEIDLMNKKKLDIVFKENKIDAIIHFAGYKDVEESMINTKKYSENITGTINLLDYMTKYHIKKIIYSSSAAVYGLPKTLPINEDAQIDIINY